jgi:hypothetical protein
MNGKKPKFFLRFLFLIILVNYLAQIPYTLHLYGFHVNPRGAALLALTFAWFLVGYWLMWRRQAIGYWMTCAFLVAQCLFYNEIVLMWYGYGFIHHLLDLHDPVVWAVQLIGTINFVFAAFSPVYFLRYGKAFRESLQGSPEMASQWRSENHRLNT